jgi:hypothetical protein
MPNEKMIDLTEQVIKNNYVLLELLNQMKTEDYNYYLPKVQAIINGNKPLSEAASEAPTLLLYEQTHWQEEEEGYPDIIPFRNDK